MFKELKAFTVRMIAGANVATVVMMLIVGFSDYVQPAHHPYLSILGLVFPVCLFANLCFLLFWLLFKLRYALIPFVGFVLCYVPVRKYVPFNMERTVPKGAIKVLSYNTWCFGQQTEDEDGNNPVIDYLEEQDADIVCLQEATHNEKEQELIERILSPMYAYRDFTMHPNGGNALALFSKYPILSKEMIPYASKGNMSMAYCLKIKGKEVLLINNHLETTGLSLEERKQFKKLVKGNLQRDTAEETSKLLAVKLAEATRKRAPQADAVSRYLEQHQGMRVILCGDFNDGPISYAHRKIAEHLTDCYVESGCGLGISYHRGGFFVRIDNMMCSKDMIPYNCHVDDKISVSDHYPIVCYLKMKPKY